MGAVKLGLVAAVLFAIAIVNDWSTPDRLIITLVAVLVIAWIWTRLSLQRLALTRSLTLDRVREPVLPRRGSWCHSPEPAYVSRWSCL